MKKPVFNQVFQKYQNDSDKPESIAKKISELESSITHVELKLSKPELLNATESKEIYAHYDKHKLQLAEEMSRWENLGAELEKARNN